MKLHIPSGQLKLILKTNCSFLDQIWIPDVGFVNHFQSLLYLNNSFQTFLDSSLQQVGFTFTNKYLNTNFSADGEPHISIMSDAIVYHTGLVSSI